MVGFINQKSAVKPRVLAWFPKYQFMARWVESLGLTSREAPGRNTFEAFPLNCAPMPKANAPVVRPNPSKTAAARTLILIKILLLSFLEYDNIIYGVKGRGVKGTA
jgi:hypothetical protein